ncbi:MAG TPA: hypothetical protein VKE95_02860 [Burkholderiales bacterium]|nr:hypothetical protein [Burkholderiales bacterium]
MAFHTADYDAYVVLGAPDCPPLWSWKIWQRFLPAIDSLIQTARGKPAVRSTQYLPDGAGVVKFGRLGWKLSDHQKWTHGSPTNSDASKSWSFLSLEVWAPAWTVCEREDLAPDVFLSIADESRGGGYGQDLLFNPVVVFALVAALAQRQTPEVSAVVSTLRELSCAKLVGYQRRPWGKPSGSIGFTNSIQDLAVSGLFRPGPRHKGELGFHLFADKWQPVPPS